MFELFQKWSKGGSVTSATRSVTGGNCDKSKNQQDVTTATRVTINLDRPCKIAGVERQAPPSPQDIIKNAVTRVAPVTETLTSSDVTDLEGHQLQVHDTSYLGCCCWAQRECVHGRRAQRVDGEA